jgi:hypothetical protein
MSSWRPSPDEERWLAVASELGTAVPRAALADRTGGWRSTGPLARIALFALGFVAAALLFGVLGFSSERTMLVAGLIAVFAAEWLTVRKRLHASGVEEGLSVAGFLMTAFGFMFIVAPLSGDADPRLHVLVLIAAAGAAGLRRLDPFVTTCAAIAFVYWVGSTEAANAIDRTIGHGTTSFAFGTSLAALALALGAREYRRPSHDRMLDWLVATLPAATNAQHGGWSAMDASYDAGAIRLATVVVLLVLGALLLITGLRRRRHAPLWGFLGCIAGLFAELRDINPFAPETLLIACGLAALFAGAALDRYLRQPRDGLTSASLTRGEGPLDMMQIAGSALLAHRAAPEAPSAEPRFEGGGGKFGGGGASGRY